MNETQGDGLKEPVTVHAPVEQGPGDAEAQAALGEMYEYGRGVLQDWHQAIAWYEKAAAQGHVKAHARLKALTGVGKVDPAPASNTKLAEKALIHSNRVRVIMDESMAWPNCCAQCCSKKDLAPVPVSFTAVDSVDYYFVVATITTRKLRFAYPICSDHKGSAHLAGLILHGHPLMSIIRFFIYLSLLIGVLTTLRAGLSSQGAGTTLLAACACLAIWWARKSLPIRLAKWDEGVADIVFGNTAFARQFIRLNPELTDPELAQRLPWHRKHRGALIMVGCFVAGMLWLVIVALKKP
ncbi:MAG TPA: hypothetical protein VF450_06925 [Noviherbaspirillum sp.]